MWWNENKLMDEDDNVLAIVQWDDESQSWEFISNLCDVCLYLSFRGAWGFKLISIETTSTSSGILFFR